MFSLYTSIPIKALIMRNKAIFSSLAIVLLVIGAVFVFKDRAQKTNSLQNARGSQSQEKWNAKLGPGKEEKLFSISEVVANCLGNCEFNPDQFWRFTVSSDLSRYAYEYWTGSYDDTKSYVVLDGQKQKEYEEVHSLRFDSTGKNFTYHAYDGKKDRTYLVYQGREIPIHSGFEWYSYSNNNVTEAFSDDGKHFAYATLSKVGEKATMRIMLDGKEINRVAGEEIKMRFQGDILQYLVSDKSKIPEDDRYYENSKLVRTIDFADYGDAFEEFRWKRNEEEGRSDCAAFTHIKSGHKFCISSAGFVLLDDVELENHKIEGHDLGFSDFVLDNEFKNVAYKITLAPMWDDEWVSLNGDNSDLVFNDIQNLHFTVDGKQIVYVGRRGADVYKVTHEVIPRMK